MAGDNFLRQSVVLADKQRLNCEKGWVHIGTDVASSSAVEQISVRANIIDNSLTVFITASMLSEICLWEIVEIFDVV